MPRAGGGSQPGLAGRQAGRQRKRQSHEPEEVEEDTGVACPVQQHSAHHHAVAFACCRRCCLLLRLSVCVSGPCLSPAAVREQRGAV